LPQANARKRRIPRERLAAWWKAASAAPNGDKFQFMLVTGMRPGETSEAKVADVDLAGGRVEIPDPKNSRAHTVLLSTQAKAIAKKRIAGKKPDELLFANGTDPRKSLEMIIAQSGVPCRAHDCRRTFSSIAGSLLPGYTVKAMLNHIDGNDVTGEHYMNIDEAALRGAWQTVANFITKRAARKAA
jgi:integrase